MASTMSGATSAVRMGAWVFTPALAGNARATLQDDYRRVDLRYSAKLLEDLLAELGLIEAHFTTLASTPKGCGVHCHELRSQVVAHV
ncbi:hypothetical protein [Streptomyces sp. DSM 118878]